mgnify:CR=1 FL=1
MDVNDIRIKILAAKEETYLAKCRAVQKYQLPLVSLALNIPGWPKSNKQLRHFFFGTLAEFKSFTLANRLIISDHTEQIIENDNGLVYFCGFKFPESAAEAKSITEKFETSHQLGRFIDVDIIDKKCQIISSGKEKPCFICHSKSAVNCMRKKNHSINELKQFQHDSIHNYLFQKHKEKQSEILSELMLNALLAEISLFPKPGLVTPIDSGSHSDMDYNSFLQSTSAISNIFTKLFGEIIIEEKAFTFESLRALGIEAEVKMKNATGNLNTHKGAIFLLIIIGYTIANLVRNKMELSPANIKNTIKKFYAAINADPLNNLANTHGNKVRKNTQNPKIGIKAEILNGLPSIFEAGIPQLYLNQFSLRNTSKEKQITLIKTLLSIMSILDDSNILYRGNEKKLQLIKEKSNIALQALINNNWEPYENLCIWTKNKNLSPGGAADILVGSIFIYLCQINPNLKTYEL